MNYRLLVPLMLACITISASCRRHGDLSDPIISNDSANSYMQLKEGNYWIYESYYVDANGVGGPGNTGGGPAVFDSVYAISDTTIGSNVYHRLKRPFEAGASDYETWYLRDSGGYAVLYPGTVLLSLQDSTTSFINYKYSYPIVFSADSFVSVSFKRSETGITVVPAGSFATISMSRTWTFYPFAAQQMPVNTRRTSLRFAKGVGIISETMPFYSADPMYVERRLVRYHVQ